MAQTGYIRAAIACTLMLCITLILCVYIHARQSRFVITQSGERAYKIDRSSGKMWLIVNEKYFPVE